MIRHRITQMQAVEMDKSSALLRSAKLEEWANYTKGKILISDCNHSTELEVSAK